MPLHTGMILRREPWDTPPFRVTLTLEFEGVRQEIICLIQPSEARKDKFHIGLAPESAQPAAIGMYVAANPGKQPIGLVDVSPQVGGHEILYFGEELNCSYKAAGDQQVTVKIGTLVDAALTIH